MSEPDVHQLRVTEVISETHDASSLVFELPESARRAFAYTPGQFLTMRLPGGAGAVARCYSLASSPHRAEAPKVTVKRVAGGLASNWICDNLGPGSVVDVLPPAGTFTPHSLDGDFLLFAAGSGVTPVISIAKSALTEGHGRVVLFYANRDERSVIFAAELAELARAHPDRFTIVHWLESVQGMPTVPQLREQAAARCGGEVFVCGPEPFMRAVENALWELDVPRTRVHVERFRSLTGDPFTTGAHPLASASEGSAARLEVELDGVTRTYDWASGVPLLDLLLAKGVDAPYSCREGACSACACVITEGEVAMLRNEVLEEEDLAEGYVLACQAVPVSQLVRVSYS